MFVINPISNYIGTCNDIIHACRRGGRVALPPASFISVWEAEFREWGWKGQYPVL